MYLVLPAPLDGFLSRCSVLDVSRGCLLRLSDADNRAFQGIYSDKQNCRDAKDNISSASGSLNTKNGKINGKTYSGTPPQRRVPKKHEGPILHDKRDSPIINAMPTIGVITNQMVLIDLVYASITAARVIGSWK
jgi:hypothetical protein